MMQAEEHIDRGSEPTETGRTAIVFVSASADDARAFRALAGGSRWLVVNVPDLAGARAVIDKLRPRFVVCDTRIEGRGSWRDLLTGQCPSPSFAVIVVSRIAGDALLSEVLHLGGSGMLAIPFVVEEVARILREV
jgi:hypothetical protein